MEVQILLSLSSLCKNYHILNIYIRFNITPLLHNNCIPDDFIEKIFTNYNIIVSLPKTECNLHGDTTMNPLFSIITVTYNAGSTIPVTLKSVKEQSCKLYECIIIDGASTDGTVGLVRESGIDNLILVSEKDNGLYDAMNKGLGLSKGDYVIFLNAGDAFHTPDTLKTIAGVIMDNDYPGIVYGQTQLVNSDRQRVGDRHLIAPGKLTLDSFKEGMLVCHQAFIVLRKLTDNYDTRYRFSSDYEWCIRCLQRSHRNLYIDETLIDYLSEGLTTRNMKRSLWERFRIMCYYFGVVPTVARHFKFLLRYIQRRRKQSKKSK